MVVFYQSYMSLYDQIWFQFILLCIQCGLIEDN